MTQAQTLPKDITDARTVLMAKHPFFAVHLLTETRIEYDPACPTAQTTGKVHTVGDWFCSRSLDERVFILAHETAHDMFGHIQRREMYRRRGFGPDMTPFRPDLFDRAADCVINDLIRAARCGTMPKEGLLDPRITYDQTVDTAYSTLRADDQDPPTGQQPDNGFDEHQTPSEDNDNNSGSGQGDDDGPGDAPTRPMTPEELDQQVTDNLSRAVNIAKADALSKHKGEVPGYLKRLIDSFVEPRQDWKALLRDFVTSYAGKDETSWARPNRRRLVLPPNLFYPGTDGCTMNCLVAAVDTSGSILPSELQLFLSELISVVEQVRPREFHVIWWDTEAVAVEIEEPEDIERAEPYGGGGTNYSCVPRKIHELGLEPDAVVCMTDGMVAWPNESDVTWPHLTITTSQGWDAPFGKSIYMDPNAD